MLTNKESCHKLPLILVKRMREEGLKHCQNDGGGQMVVAFTITEVNYLVVSLFCNLVQAISYLYLRY